ncbi:MAG: DNA adenine methylase [Ignavibacteria bacterium]|nr:DNA adenine methylase [Ignavibacteria bacterium]
MNYIEPFCGSAALLFHKEKSDIEIINDLDQNIYSLFKVLIDKKLFLEFKELCDLTPYSEELLKEYTNDLKKDDLNILERAYKFFYCNRTSYNGVGGFSSSGVIRRKMSKPVSDYLSAIDGLYEIHNRLSSVIIHNTNALNLIKKWDKQNTFMYCDSPYANETRSSGKYKHDMTDKQQDEYLKILLSIKNAKILVSGYNCERYSILEKNGWNRIDMEIKTQNNNRISKSKIESLWYNYEQI